MIETIIYIGLAQLVITAILYAFLKYCTRVAMDSIRDAELELDAAENRFAIAVALERGDYEYQYLEIGAMPKDATRDGIEEMRDQIEIFVEEKYPGATFDLDKSDIENGRLAFLLPRAD